MFTKRYKCVILGNNACFVCLVLFKVKEIILNPLTDNTVCIYTKWSDQFWPVEIDCTVEWYDQVLWPECGWQPVSLTDMITAASVKKAYRKATLCIHPDKVQQKGANLQQKYVAEKVFDLLKVYNWLQLNSREFISYA